MELKNERISTRDLQKRFFKNEKYFNKCRKEEIKQIEFKINIFKEQIKKIKMDSWIK